MSNDRTPEGDREEPPFVLGLVIGGMARFEDACRRAILSIDRRVQLFLWAAGTIVAFLAILSLSIAQSPGAARLQRNLYRTFPRAVVRRGCGLAAVVGAWLTIAQACRVCDRRRCPRHVARSYMADAVIELDFCATGRARDTMSAN